MCFSFHVVVDILPSPLIVGHDRRTVFDINAGAGEWWSCYRIVKGPVFHCILGCPRLPQRLAAEPHVPNLGSSTLAIGI